MESEPTRLARDLLLGEDVLHDRDQAPRTIAAAQGEDTRVYGRYTEDTRRDPLGRRRAA